MVHLYLIELRMVLYSKTEVSSQSVGPHQVQEFLLIRGGYRYHDILPDFRREDDSSYTAGQSLLVLTSDEGQA